MGHFEIVNVLETTKLLMCPGSHKFFDHHTKNRKKLSKFLNVDKAEIHMCVILQDAVIFTTPEVIGKDGIRCSNTYTAFLNGGLERRCDV